MRFLIAPTAYKGTLSPVEAAEIIAAGVDAHTTICPIADGGTGWLEVWHYHFPDAERFRAEVSDALLRPQRAEWLLLPNGAAVIESAQVIGLHTLRPEERAPLDASSRGVGELLRAAAVHPTTQRLWLGLGGVATTDGGAGALQALGFRLLNAQGEPTATGGHGLLHLHAVEPPDTDPLLGKPLALCADVQSPLLDAARVFAPQKGATPSQVEQLVRGLERLAEVALRDTGVDLHAVLGAGAAGGLAGGLHAYLRVPLVSGTMWLLTHIGWEQRLAQADCLITGEGQIDAQTLMGKGVGVLIQQAVALGKPVIVLAGRTGAGWQTVAQLPKVAVYACIEIAPDAPPAEALRLAARQALRNYSPTA